MRTDIGCPLASTCRLASVFTCPHTQRRWGERGEREGRIGIVEYEAEGPAIVRKKKEFQK